MISEPFDRIRESVSCLDAAQRYSGEVNRAGFALCPWHSDRHPSLKLYGPGRGCYCFSCGRSEDVIGYTAALLGVDRMTAARTLNADFGLCLAFDRPPTDAERETARRRMDDARIGADFKAWQEEMIHLLTVAHRIGWCALRDLPESEWSPAEVEAIKLLPTLSYWLEQLSGTMEERMGVFRTRREARSKCREIILRASETSLRTPKRSSAS